MNCTISMFSLPFPEGGSILHKSWITPTHESVLKPGVWDVVQRHLVFL